LVKFQLLDKISARQPGCLIGAVIEVHLFVQHAVSFLSENRVNILESVGYWHYATHLCLNTAAITPLRE